VFPTHTPVTNPLLPEALLTCVICSRYIVLPMSPGRTYLASFMY
jgi:hypothetical protein